MSQLSDGASFFARPPRALVREVLCGKPVIAKISTGSEVVTKDNLSDPSMSKYLYSFTCPAD